MNANDVVLTGLPRSGTTLTCELLMEAPDTVALDEPMDAAAWGDERSGGALSKLTKAARGLLRSQEKAPAADPAAAVRRIDRYFEQTRRSLLGTGSAASKNVEGRLTTRVSDDDYSNAGLRLKVKQTTRSVISVEKPLSPDFTLVVKHNARFTSLLEPLAARYRAYAVVRNPLSTMSSWQTVAMPIQHGRVPRTERVDADLRARLAAVSDRLDRQFVLLQWFWEKFHAHLAPEAILRYEDVITSGGQALAVISPRMAEANRSLDSRNKAAVYDREMMRLLGERLLASEGPYWDFYTRDSVVELMEDAGT